VRKILASFKVYRLTPLTYNTFYVYGPNALSISRLYTLYIIIDIYTRQYTYRYLYVYYTGDTGYKIPENKRIMNFRNVKSRNINFRTVKFSIVTSRNKKSRIIIFGIARSWTVISRKNEHWFLKLLYIYFIKY